MASNVEHVGDDALERYVLRRRGTATPDDSDSALEEHLLVCRYCSGRAEQFEAMAAAFRTALKDSGRQ